MNPIGLLFLHLKSQVLHSFQDVAAALLHVKADAMAMTGGIYFP